MNLANSLYLRALRRESVERPPVWIMRQAGRYLPEYRATRAKAGSFLKLCKTPELACEVTLQPLKRFALDAAILFSDILTIPDAMGLDLSFVEGEGPVFARPLNTLKDIETVAIPKASVDLKYVMEAVKTIRNHMPVNLPLIGFSGSPWTLACYMLEGKSSKDFKKAMVLMYQEPDAMHMLLQKLTAAIVDYLDEQVQAGANALMVFDTWGGLLSPGCFNTFSCAYLTEIVTQLKIKHPDVPITLFTKGGSNYLSQLVATECDALGLDWMCDIGIVRRQFGSKVALQGNLDPSILLTSKECIEREVKKVLDAFGPYPGHIFNLGHGITPDVPPENLSILIQTIHEYAARRG